MRKPNPFWIILLIGLISIMMMNIANAEKDCLDYSLESGEPVMLIGKHPFFYGSIDSNANHYVNYKQIDNRTLEIHDYMHDRNYIFSGDWDEIRPGVYYDGFNYFKLFIYREPQRYWRKMI